EINEIIQEVIIERNVKNIVLLLDADTLAIKWADNKDLYTRQKSFANAVSNFRNSLHLLVEDKNVKLEQVYFMHLKTRYYETAKGLDDLLIQLSAKTKDIMQDLHNFHFAKTYFEGIMLTDGQTSSIERHFGLMNKQDFYNL